MFSRIVSSLCLGAMLCSSQIVLASSFPFEVTDYTRGDAVDLDIFSTASPPTGSQHTLPHPQGMAPGWTATTLRIISHVGNITGLNFSGVTQSGTPHGVYGHHAQIWVSPNADGHHTQTTPGFRNENNTTSSEFNLDSHFLGDPANFVIRTPLTEGNIAFPGFNPLSSTNVFGYGSGVPFHLVHDVNATGYLRGAFDVVPTHQASTIDFAYLALGGGGFVLGDVHTTAGTFPIAVGFSTGQPFPEPSSLLTASVVLITTHRHRFRTRKP